MTNRRFSELRRRNHHQSDRQKLEELKNKHYSGNHTQYTDWCMGCFLFRQLELDLVSRDALAAAKEEIERLKKQFDIYWSAMRTDYQELVSQLTAERESKEAARGEVDRLRRQIGTQREKVEEQTENIKEYQRSLDETLVRK